MADWDWGCGHTRDTPSRSDPGQTGASLAPMLRSVRSAAGGVCAAVAAAVLACAITPSARAADWLPTFGLGATDVSAVKMTPRGDVAIELNTSAGPALRFRPVGGPLGPLTHPFPNGASGADIDMDARGNTYLAWIRAGAIETRVRRRDGTLTPIQKVQQGAVGARVAVARNGRAVLAWISSDPGRTAAARTRAADGTLGMTAPFTVSGEKTREFDLDVASDGNATLVWTTPDAPPNTKVKARTLDFDSQTLSAVHDISTPPSPELSDTPRVAVDPAGNATIVWRHDTATASLTETRKLSAAGVLSFTQTLTSPGFTSQAHDVAVDDAGNARVVWVEHDAAHDADPFLPTTCISAVSSSCGARATLSTSQSLSASVAMGPAGDAMVGWADPAGTVRFLPRVGGAGGNGLTHVLSRTAQRPEMALDGAGDGIAVWRQGGSSKGAGFDAVAPKIKRLSIPRVIRQGVRVRASARVFDVWGASIRWRFGDGSRARGRSVHHTFEHAGSFRVRVLAVDGAGASQVVSRKVRVKHARG